MKRGWARLAVLAAIAGAVTGCANLPAPMAPPGVLSGRLALKVDAHDREPAHSMNANFELSGDAGKGELNLATPLGTTLARARWQPGEALLTTSQGEARYGDLADLAEAAFGERIPLEVLPDWLRGHPWAGAASHPQASPAGFVQLGWTIDLSRMGEGWIIASRKAPPAVLLRAKLDAGS